MLPEAFTERMQRMLGKEYEAFRKALEEERYQALRLNPLKKGTDGRSAAEKYGSGGQEAGFAHLTQVPWAAEGYYYRGEDQPGRHPFHEAGLYYIQEPSAMAPAELLGVEPGDRVLDLCAAPGGKSTQIAARLRGQGFLVSNEIHPARAKILSENIERLGIGNACVTNEPPERLAAFFAGFFDKILVDAPCSGEGMFRKNEAACEEWSPENVALCAKRQDGILDCAAKMLRPGGRLVYSTCTFAPEENEGSVGRFLRRHGDFSLLPIEKEELGLGGCDGSADYPETVEAEADRAALRNTLRIWPQRVRGEGHFAALLQKDGGMTACAAGRAGRRTASPPKPARGNPEKDMEVFHSFCSENIRFPESVPETDSQALFAAIGQAAGLGKDVDPVRFGENLYLVPAMLPDLKGLKVLRPGLHLGELKKNRFEPSHALALALNPAYAAHRWELEADDPLTAAYLTGQTFPAEGEKGWYLICVDGFGIGWGKLAAGSMKNHYPIGLRRKDFRRE